MVTRSVWIRKDGIFDRFIVSMRDVWRSSPMHPVFLKKSVKKASPEHSEEAMVVLFLILFGRILFLINLCFCHLKSIQIQFQNVRFLFSK